MHKWYSSDNFCCKRIFFSHEQIVNHHLLKDLTEMGLWNDDMKNQLIANNGSIQVIILYNDCIDMIDIPKLSNNNWLFLWVRA